MNKKTDYIGASAFVTDSKVLRIEAQPQATRCLYPKRVLIIMERRG